MAKAIQKTKAERAFTVTITLIGIFMVMSGFVYWGNEVADMYCQAASDPYWCMGR